MPNTANLTLFKDTFKSAEKAINWRIDEDVQSHNPEASGKVDYKHVLGRVVGEGFLVNGTSVNRRFYSRELWEKQRIQRANELESGGLFGAFGHEQELTAVDLGAGKASHLTTDFWIDESGIGFIEILILNTETGRNLNTYLRANKRIPVSSRGYGSVLETNADGIDILDPDTFYLMGWDFVLDPGVSSAYPALVEHVEDVQVTKPLLKDGQKMDENTKQLLALTESKSKAEAKVELMSEQAKSAVAENEALKAKIALYEGIVGTPDQAKQLNESVMKWLVLEPFRSFAKEHNLFQDKLFDIFPKINSQFESIQTKEKTQSDIMSAYTALGKPESLKVIVEQCEAYAKLGKVETLTKMCESFKRIKKAINAKAKDKKIDEAVALLVKEFAHVDEAVIKSLLTSMAPAKALETVKLLNAKAKPAAKNEEVGKGKPAAKTNEENTHIDPFKPVRLTSITGGGNTKSNEQDMAKRLNESMLSAKKHTGQ